MKNKILLIILSLSYLNTNIQCFDKKQTAVIVSLSTLEFVALQKKFNIFDLVDGTGLTFEEYWTHALTNSFPTFMGQQPIINGTEMRSLLIIGAILAQNIFLYNRTKKITDKDNNSLLNILTTTLATSSGGVIAWGASLLYSSLQCNK